MCRSSRVRWGRGSCNRRIHRAVNSIFEPSSSVYTLQHPHRLQGLKGHGCDSTHYPHLIGPLKNTHASDQASDVGTDKQGANMGISPLVSHRYIDLITQMQLKYVQHAQQKIKVTSIDDASTITTAYHSVLSINLMYQRTGDQSVMDLDRWGSQAGSVLSFFQVSS